MLYEGILRCRSVVARGRIMVRKDGEAVGEKGCGLARLDFNFNHSLWTDISVSKLQATKPMDKKKKTHILKSQS